ncbi:MAG: hypothetical protein PHX62_03680 [Bacilli bacterium]|nr:hypothetical protein [Bacilli bacterium]
MNNETVSISLNDLDNIYNVINSLRNELLQQSVQENEKYWAELEKEPVSFGYLTTYRKQDGTFFQKRTKYLPFDYSLQQEYKVGDINSFGHEIICIVEDLQLNLKLNDIDYNKKWYVD